MASVERESEPLDLHQSSAEGVLVQPKEKGKNSSKEVKGVGLKTKIVEARRRLGDFFGDVFKDDGFDGF